MGIGVINRLSFDGDSGKDSWEGYPSHILDLAMIEVDENFSGKIDSKTFDGRLSIAFSLPTYKQLSFGTSFVYVD